jgi:DeoR/GlpR family transcriptional regulator of sugar metabolism
MLTPQRDETILTRLRETGSASAQELAELLGVSGSTVRRDLERLELLGALRRVHGGAYFPSIAGGENSFAEVVDENAAEKEAVAARAAQLVSDGEVVILDIGTTTMRIAHHLRGREVTVITSSLAVLDVLRTDGAVNLVMLGGTLRRNFQTLVGPITEDVLATIRADIAFLTCTGVRPDGSVVDDITQEASIKRALVNAADRVVLATTSSKFPGTGSLRIAHLESIDVVVTTAGVDEATLAHARRGGGEVILV